MKNAKLENDRFKTQLNNFLNQPINPITAKTYLKAWRSAASPILVIGEDGKRYVVKGKKAGRQAINDQIVARLGLEINAPVGRPEIIYISQELIDIEPNHFEDFDAGTAHGTEFIPNCIDSYELRAIDAEHNRIR